MEIGSEERMALNSHPPEQDDTILIADLQHHANDLEDFDAGDLLRTDDRAGEPPRPPEGLAAEDWWGWAEEKFLLQQQHNQEKRQFIMRIHSEWENRDALA